MRVAWKFCNAQAPESWLEWVGWRKLVFGLHANRKWHYTGPLGQPSRHVRWYIRSIGAPQPETIINLYVSFKCWLTCSLPLWTIEAREAAEEEEEANADGNGADEGGHLDDYQNDGGGGSGAPSTTSSVRSARALARYKRIMASAGLIGTYICWAIFTWCAARERLLSPGTAGGKDAHHTRPTRHSHARRFIFVYGMLIYKLLGDEAQREFARSWGAYACCTPSAFGCVGDATTLAAVSDVNSAAAGVSYGLNAATEWQGILEEVVKGAVILAILERVCLTRNSSWLEARSLWAVELR
jgi:hypothetical protein